MIACLRTVVVPPETRARYLAWIATPERDRLTASEVHEAVDHRAITRYEVAGGYLDTAGLARVSGDSTDTTTEEDAP
jgi:hypothetical protein